MVSGELPPGENFPRLGLGFGSELGLELGFLGQFSSGALVQEPLILYLIGRFVGCFITEKQTMH